MANKENSDILIEVKNLKKYFIKNKGFIKKDLEITKAVDDVSFFIRKGETLGLVGESGCGKSTTGRTIIRLYEPTAGEIIYNGKDIAKLNKDQMMLYRKKMQMIFQDPYSSLNPKYTVGEIIGEALIDHNLEDKNSDDLKKRILSTMEKCGLASHHIERYPHEFSGGQRQRIGIARALILNPSFIVADEPVSALDVSIQAQIINLMMDLQHEMGFSYLFISHDLSVVKHICHRIGVMYLGSLVELAPKKEIYENPLHPYTKSLLSSIPIPDPAIKRSRIILKGDIPSPANPPKGCKFHTRCPYSADICMKLSPEYKDAGNNHFVACHLIK